MRNKLSVIQCDIPYFKYYSRVNSEVKWNFVTKQNVSKKGTFSVLLLINNSVVTNRSLHLSDFIRFHIKIVQLIILL